MPGSNQPQGNAVCDQPSRQIPAFRNAVLTADKRHYAAAGAGGAGASSTAGAVAGASAGAAAGAPTPQPPTPQPLLLLHPLLQPVLQPLLQPLLHPVLQPLSQLCPQVVMAPQLLPHEAVMTLQPESQVLAQPPQAGACVVAQQPWFW